MQLFNIFRKKIAENTGEAHEQAEIANARTQRNTFTTSKENEPTVSVSSQTIMPDNKYNPWAKNDKTVNDNYAIAAFVRISQSGGGVGHTNDDYARYFNYRFGICDPISYHKKVISEGYLVEAPVSIALKKLKVEQLKSMLDSAGLPNKGKKDDLISRIMENIDAASLGLEKCYVPSEKGMAHLKKYEYVFAVNNYGVSCEEYEAQKEKVPAYFKQNDIIWQTLNQKFNEHNIAGDFGLARNDQFHMAQLLESEGKSTDALFHYCLVLYYDTSGCGNGKGISDPHNIPIAPALTDAIRKLKGYYDPQIIGRCYDRYKLPHHYISKQNFEQMLIAIFENQSVDVADFIG